MTIVSFRGRFLFVRVPDGRMQATYNDWPLYYFAEDFVPGDINGHDLEEFGGEWYLVTTGRRRAASLTSTKCPLSLATSADNSDVPLWVDTVEKLRSCLLSGSS